MKCIGITVTMFMSAASFATVASASSPTSTPQVTTVGNQTIYFQNGKHAIELAQLGNSSQVIKIPGTSTNSLPMVKSAALIPGVPVATAAPALSIPQFFSDPNWTYTNLNTPISSTTGSWTNSPTSFAYQWYSCGTPFAANNLALPTGCSVIGGATQATYTVTGNLLLGTYLLVSVTASNGLGSSSTWSSTSPEVVSFPQATVLPSMSGSATVGSVLTAVTGSWTGFPTPTFLYNWFDCTATISATINSAPPATCFQINSAYSSTYTLQSSDIGYFVTVEVTGLMQLGNSGFGVPYFTATTAAVTDPNSVPPTPATSAPSMTSVPQLSTLGASGSTWWWTTNGAPVYTTSGTWANSPSSFAYQWYSCTAPVLTTPTGIPSGCSAINGAIGPTFLTGSSSLLGTYLLASVSASNNIGTTTAWTITSPEVIQPAWPTIVPSLSGNAVVGNVLTSNPGIWTGFPTPSFVYSWFKCTIQIISASNMAPPLGCSQILGSNTNTYTVQPADLGYYLASMVSGQFLTFGTPFFTSTTAAVVPAQVAQATLIVTNAALTSPANNSFTLTTTGGSGGGITSFSVTGTGCTLSGLTNNVLATTQAGNCVVTASNAGDSNYLPATSAPVTFTFTPIAQTLPVVITNTPLSAQNGSNLLLTASGGNGNGTITFATSSAGCTLVGTALTRATSGTCAVKATKAAEGIYAAASSASATFTFAAPTNQAALTISNITKSFTATSVVGLTTSGGTGGGAVSYSISGGTAGTSGSNCVINGSTLSTTKAGTCIAVATKASNGIYNATSSAAVTFTFTAVAQNAFTLVPSSTTGPAGTPISLSVSGGSGSGAYSFASATSGCTVATTDSTAGTGTVVRSASTGSCSVTATHAASGIYSASTSGVVTITFSAAPQSNVLLSPATSTGTAGTAIALTASGGSGAGAYSFASSTSGCTVTTTNSASGTGTINRTTATGTCSITATKAANGIYASVTSAPVVVTFGAATQAALNISNANAANIAKGTTGITLAATGGSGTGAVTYAVTGTGCTLSGSKLTVATTYLAGTKVSCSVVATKAASGIYGAISSIAKVFNYL